MISTIYINKNSAVDKQARLARKILYKTAKEQKFTRGTLVKVTSLGFGKRSWGHMSNRYAIVVATYAEQYGGDNYQDYTLHFIDTNSAVSWFHELELTPVKIRKK